MKFKNLLNILNPQPQIGSMEITDVDLKFCEIKFYNSITHSLKLESGIIKDGIIKDKNAFIAALSNFHNQITGNNKKKKVNVIVNIPDNNIYSQLFNLPNAASDNLEEAVKLNLQMISPIKFEEAYVDWQIFNSGQLVEGNQYEIIGSFAQKEIIDTFEYCLKSSGFVVVAIEFSGLALTRTAIMSGAAVDVKEPFILLYIGQNGLSFNLVKSGNLYFNHFVSWQSIYADERKIIFESFKKLVIEEIKKVSSFYFTHWGGQLKTLYLVSYGLQEEIMKVISENFSFKVQPLSIQKYNNISPQWFSAFGSALRGNMPRIDDNIISVASIGTEKEFRQEKIIWFIKVWSNIVLSSLVVLIITFSAADLFLVNIGDSLKEKFSSTSNIRSNESVEILNLRNQVDEINKKIQLVSLAYGKRSRWFSFFGKIEELGGGNISFARIFIQSPEAPVLINASARNEEAALNFKEKLSNNLNIENIEMPINKIISTSDGISFSISFKIKSF